jgi:glycosyltransferase involved in cell wall biosynthesis
MSRKILYIAMHLSTGGSPQWLFELLKEAKKSNEVFVVEFSRYSSDYTVQRDRILDLIGSENFTSLGHYNSKDYDQQKERLIDVIKSFNPDIVHFNEVPENFEYKGFGSKLLRKIYEEERAYKILETCHNNSFDFSTKEVWPDAFVAVSEFQKINLELLGKKCYLWDYEIQKKERPDREEALKALGLDPNKKHILNIGLFHANKNQKYIYDMASKLIDLVGLSIEFHFVGNECFKGNCGISDLDLPNCRVWGERDDVDAFYSCMDLFLFPSIRELNPLCIKEALSWGMPIIMNKIKACDLYKKYEDNSSVKFIQDIDVEKEITSLIKPTETKVLPPISAESKKKVLIKFNSRSLGDSLGWIPYVE